MKKMLSACLAIPFAGFMGGKAIAAAYTLYDWAFYVDGTLYSAAINTSADLPSAGFNMGAFDWSTGLGTLAWTTSSAGPHRFAAFFDHEIDEAINTFFNEHGEASGTPDAHQSWEIDEPGYVFGDIYTHMQSFGLDNTNGVPPTTPDDVSMALGWVFQVNPAETGIVTLTLASLAPSSGFYLTHTDPASPVSLFYQGTVYTSGTPVPEPGTMLLLGSGLAGLAGMRLKKRSR